MSIVNLVPENRPIMSIGLREVGFYIPHYPKGCGSIKPKGYGRASYRAKGVFDILTKYKPSISLLASPFREESSDESYKPLRYVITTPKI